MKYTPLEVGEATIYGHRDKIIKFVEIFLEGIEPDRRLHFEFKVTKDKYYSSTKNLKKFKGGNGSKPKEI